MSQNIRLATVADSESILKIYAPYVVNTTISFENEIPDINEFSERVRNISSTLPYLVYESDGEIVGYSYASKHKERAAYYYDVESSIYVSQSYHGKGVAYKLYMCLFALLKEMGYYNLYAAYSVPNEKSAKFHEKCGFTYIGVYHKAGYKFGRWIDLVWMEKTLMEHVDNPGRVKPIGELSEQFLKEILTVD